MIRRLADLAFLLVSMPGTGVRALSPESSVAECPGNEADAAHAAVHFDGKVGDFLTELERVKHVAVAHAERVGDASARLNFSCLPVDFLVDLAAEASGTLAVREGDGKYRMVKIKNFEAIAKLRSEASAARGGDRAKLKRTLERIVALSQPGGPEEAAAPVEAEYHELGNLAMKDKDYPAAERFYRARLAELDRNKSPQDTDYAIAVSNVADALGYRDDAGAAKAQYERALALFDKQSDAAAPPNALIILHSLSNAAL